MIKKNNFNILIIFCLVFSFFYICIIRYFKSLDLTQIFGLNSYRATHWLVNYFEFGFIKRGLVGSLIKSIYNDDIISYFLILICSLFVLFFFIASLLFYARNLRASNLHELALITFLFSHAFIYFYTLDLGRFDQINNILLLISSYLIIKHDIRKIIIPLFLFILVGTLVHEAFLLTQFPTILFILFYKEYNTPPQSYKNSLLKSSIVIFFGLISASIIYFFGYIEGLNPEEMKFILSNITNINVDIGVLQTFFYNPLDDLFIGAKSIFCIDKMLCRPYTLITLVINNLPFLLIIVFFIYKLIKSKEFILVDGIFILVCFIPLFTEIFITFIDYYRIDATLLLNLFIFMTIKQQYQSNNNYTLNLNLKTFLIIALIFNFIIINIHLIFNNYSSSVSPVNYLLFNFVK